MINSYSEHKRFLILNILNHLGTVSRTGLASLTGFQLASISSLTRQLISEGILVETGSYSAGHGRNRILLALNKPQLCAISISFTQAAVTFTAAQFDGTILESSDIILWAELTEEDLLSRICAHTLKMLEAYRDKIVIGIGICTPVNDPAAYPIAPVKLSFVRIRDWVKNLLLPRLKETVSIPVHLFYDIVLGTLAEQMFGSAKGVSDFICVELSNGIGCSICCNGRPVTGAMGTAGELGHTVIDLSAPQKKLCYCGKPGCIESVASLPKLLEAISRSLDDNVSSLLAKKNEPRREITVKDVRLAVEKGDRMCRYHVKQAAVYLGAAIANAVMLLNPKMVVLHGLMLELGDYFLENLKDALTENITMSAEKNAPEIIVSPTLEKLLPLGAIADIFSSYLRKEDFNWVYRLPLSDET